MARRPDPVPLKLLKGRGNNKDSAGREIPRVPSFERCAPSPPDWLDDVALEEWSRVAPSLEQLGLLKDEDRAALAVYCSTWSVFVAAAKAYQREGMSKKSAQGGLALHPAMRVMTSASATLLRFAQQFGLTPAAEIALAKPVVKTAADDGDDAYAASGTAP